MTKTCNLPVCTIIPCTPISSLHMVYKSGTREMPAVLESYEYSSGKQGQRRVKWWLRWSSRFSHAAAWCSCCIACSLGRFKIGFSKQVTDRFLMQSCQSRCSTCKKCPCGVINSIMHQQHPYLRLHHPQVRSSCVVRCLQQSKQHLLNIAFFFLL